jgi:twitching motility protein PilI
MSQNREAASPHALLKAMESGAVSAVTEGMEAGEQGRHRTLAFDLQGMGIVCDMAEVSLVAPCAPVTPVPQTKEWVRGVCNIRGTIYSVADLALFAGSIRSVPIESGHLILVNHPDMQVALLVSNVIGFRNFDPDSLQGVDHENVEFKQGQAGDLDQFVRGYYYQADKIWFVVDLLSLANSNRFREVQ